MDLKLKDNALLATPEIERLNYITASGQCNIDTGVDFNSHTASNYYANQIKIDAVIEVISNTTNNARIYDANGGGSAGNTIKLQCNGTSSTSFKAWCNNYTSETGLAVTFTGKTHIVQGFGYIEINGVRSTITPKNAGFVYRFKILSTTGLTINIHSFKIYLGDTLVRDYVPMCVNNIPCLYDSVNNVPYYSASTGTFTANYTSPANSITTAYVKDCPNISGIDILRNCPNLTRVRIDVGNISASINELLSYTTLAGFDDNYEPQVKPRLVGTWTVNSWHRQEQLDQLDGVFDGLTIISDPNYFVNFDNLALQTLDSTKPNYNPALAIRLRSMEGNNKTLGIVLSYYPFGEGRFFVTKTQAASWTLQTLTSFLHSINTVTDSEGLVSTDKTATYKMENTKELIYFTSITSMTHAGYNCSNIKSIWLPPSLQTFNDNNNRSSPFYIRFTATNPPTPTGSNTTLNLRSGINYYVGNGDKYADQIALENYLSSSYINPIRTKLYTWYSYVTPMCSYNGTTVTITIGRTSTIYYTTDGSTPTIQSTQYTEPFNWNGVGVIKTIAVSDEEGLFNIINGEDFYANTVSNPVISYTSTNVAITAEQGATIYYTLDGTLPNENSDVYTEPVTVTGDIVKVRCFARVEGKNDSEVVGKICVIDDTLWGTDGDSSYFAVQAIDSTKPNYNPSVIVQLFKKSIYVIPCLNGGGGYITKTEASNITSTSDWFNSVETITDNVKLTQNTDISYDFETFNEFKYFTNLTSIANSCFFSCKKLTSIILPNSVKTIGSQAFYRCNKISYMNLPTSITYIDYRSFDEVGTTATNITLIDVNLPNLVTVYSSSQFNNNKLIREVVSLGSATRTGGQMFSYCPNLTKVTLPSTITTVSQWLLRGVNNCILHLESVTPPTLEATTTFIGSNCKIYVGSGVAGSASDSGSDAAILATYLADSSWSAFSSILDTWYNYLHPTT